MSKEDKMKSYEPETCGYSLCFYEVCICRLTTTPCPMKYSNECVAEKCDKAIKKIFNT